MWFHFAAGLDAKRQLHRSPWTATQALMYRREGPSRRPAASALRLTSNATMDVAPGLTDGRDPITEDVAPATAEVRCRYACPVRRLVLHRPTDGHQRRGRLVLRQQRRGHRGHAEISTAASRSLTRRPPSTVQDATRRYGQHRRTVVFGSSPADANIPAALAERIVHPAGTIAADNHAAAMSSTSTFPGLTGAHLAPRAT